MDHVPAKDIVAIFLKDPVFQNNLWEFYRHLEIRNKQRELEIRRENFFDLTVRILEQWISESGTLATIRVLNIALGKTNLNALKDTLSNEYKATCMVTYQILRPNEHYVDDKKALGGVPIPEEMNIFSQNSQDPFDHDEISNGIRASTLIQTHDQTDFPDNILSNLCQKLDKLNKLEYNFFTEYKNIFKQKTSTLQELLAIINKQTHQLELERNKREKAELKLHKLEEEKLMFNRIDEISNEHKVLLQENLNSQELLCDDDFKSVHMSHVKKHLTKFNSELATNSNPSNFIPKLKSQLETVYDQMNNERILRVGEIKLKEQKEAAKIALQKNFNKASERLMMSIEEVNVIERNRQSYRSSKIVEIKRRAFIGRFIGPMLRHKEIRLIYDDRLYQKAQEAALMKVDICNRQCNEDERELEKWE